MDLGHQPADGSSRNQDELAHPATNVHRQLERMLQWEADCNHLLKPTTSHTLGVISSLI